MNKPAKQQKMLESLIKREDWELETVRANFAVAKDQLEQATTDLNNTKTVLKDLDSQLRASMQNGANIDFAMLNMAKQYIRDKKDEERRHREVFRKAKKITDQVETELLDKVATKKGYERVLERHSEEMNKEVAKKVGREIEDNWLQRHGGKHD